MVELLRLPARAYVATEAVAAVSMHLTKSAVYGRYAAIDTTVFVAGVVIGGAMILGSWTGRRLIERMTDRRFDLLVEMLLIVAALRLVTG